MGDKHELTGMTVGDLIRELQRQDPDARVAFAHPSHDHWRTTVVTGVGEVARERLEWSEYHRQFKLPSGDRDDEGEGIVVTGEGDDDENAVETVVLS